MEIVVERGNDGYGPLGNIKDGEAFEVGGYYYIRPSEGLRRRGDIGGVNLKLGTYIANNDSMRVRPVKIQAHVFKGENR